MKKSIFVALIALFTLFGKVYAEVSYGVSVALTSIDATGSETEGGETTNGTADNTVLIPSVFVENQISDTLSFGLDYIPMKADVSSKTKKRTDTETSVSGTKTTTSTTRVQKAQAELENHLTLYANYMLNDTYFVKAGVAYVTLKTAESLGTGSSYGNEDIYGGVIGLGAKTDQHRFELVYTDYEDISLTSSQARTGVTTNNKISAELDTVQFKYSYAF